MNSMMKCQPQFWQNTKHIERSGSSRKIAKLSHIYATLILLIKGNHSKPLVLTKFLNELGFKNETNRKLLIVQSRDIRYLNTTNNDFSVV